MTGETGLVPARAAVITGAASGIGRSTVLLFLEQGWEVVAVDRREEALGALTAAIPPLQRDHLALQAVDVSDEAAVAKWAENLAARYPTVTALVNAAGIGLFAKKLDTIQPAEWNRVLATNLTGPFLMTKALVPRMRTHGGQIINLSSVHAVATSFGMAAYASAKAGLMALTRATAIDYRQERIRCNCLLIGSVDTPMSAEHKRALDALQMPDLGIDPALVAEPHEIAQVIHLLASGAASFVNGSCLTVDGGLLAEL
jgi:NAD(P)-dependent dehydrogenase (short-subunit alcohol dehydrogenase family)